VIFRRRGAAELFEQAERHRDRGEDTAAAELYGQVLQAGNRDLAVRASYGLGLVLVRRGDLAEAARTFRTVVDTGHEAHAPPAAYALAGVLVRQGDQAGAVAAFREALASGHADAAPRAALCLAELHEDRDELERAAEQYTVAVGSRHPEVAGRAAYGLASLRERRGDVGAAMAGYRAAVSSGDPEAAALGRAALRRLGAGDAADEGAAAGGPGAQGEYALVTTRIGEHGFRFHDAARGAEVAADPALVEAMLARHHLWYLVGIPFYGYPDGNGYVISFIES
jgi:tetratricopeptide (TPR) repeat protein